MARKTKQDTEKTYLALLNAAADLFLKKGITRTTLQEIAVRAGMTRGALYWHFNNKDEIVMAIVSSFTLPLIKQMEADLTSLPKENVADAFRAVLHSFLSSISEDRLAGQAISIIFRVIEITEEETELQIFLRQIRDSVLNSMLEAAHFIHEHNGLRKDLAPDLAAKGITCYIEGMVHQYYSVQPFVDLKTDGASMLDVYLDAICA